MKEAFEISHDDDIYGCLGYCMPLSNKYRGQGVEWLRTQTLGLGHPCLSHVYSAYESGKLTSLHFDGNMRILLLFYRVIVKFNNP